MLERSYAGRLIEGRDGDSICVSARVNVVVATLSIVGRLRASGDRIGDAKAGVNHAAGGTRAEVQDVLQIAVDTRNRRLRS